MTTSTLTQAEIANHAQRASNFTSMHILGGSEGVRALALAARREALKNRAVQRAMEQIAPGRDTVATGDPRFPWVARFHGRVEVRHDTPDGATVYALLR